MVSELMSRTVPDLFTKESTNFFLLDRSVSVKIADGTNNLDSCFQYVVTDVAGQKLLNIKVYDKVLDLVGREATFKVSTRVPTILGSRG